MQAFRRTRLIGAAVAGFFVLGVASPASSAPNRSVWGAVVRIANREDGGASVGSGTIISCDGRVAIVATCAHLFSEGEGDVVLIQPGGVPKRAVVVAIDPENDLACLIVAQQACPTIPLAEELPKVGSKLVSCGFGSEGVFRVNRGEHLGFVTLRGGEPQGVLEISGSARYGDSGGPIVNSRGELVGVIMGTDGDTVDGTHCQRLRAFLADNPPTPKLIAQAVELASQPLDDRAALFSATFRGSVDERAGKPVTAVLSGRVTFERSGVTGARVRISGRASREMDLDDDGRFAFDALPIGRYRIEVEKIVKNRYRAASQWIELSSAIQSETIELELE